MSVASLRSAVAFLTIVPVARRTEATGERLGRALFPVVGAALGLASWAGLWVGTRLAGSLFGAIVAVAVLALLSGGLHLDGLADCADGLLLSGPRERRLQVMRDPRLGSFGVIALVFVLLADVALIAHLDTSAALAALLLSGAASRLVMLTTVIALPYVRAEGLGVAARGKGRLDLAVGAALVAPLLLLGWPRGVVAVGLAATVGAGIAALARARIGGATGDVYGAVCESAQLAALLAFAVTL